MTKDAEKLLSDLRSDFSNNPIHSKSDRTAIIYNLFTGKYKFSYNQFEQITNYLFKT